MKTAGSPTGVVSAARVVLQRKIGATTSDRRESYRDLMT
jgi:hypothetical protein